MVAAGLLAVIKTGGLADQAIGPFQDTRSVVAEAGASLVPDQLEGGIRFSAMPSEDQKQIRESVGDGEATVTRITQTMEDLKNHRQDAIRGRAEAFKQLNSADWLADSQKEQLLSKIDSSQTNDEVMTAVSEFMAIYGKKAEFAPTDVAKMGAFDKETPVANVQDTARLLIDIYSSLPTSMVKKFGFSTVEFATAHSLVGTQAMYSGTGAGDTRGKMFIPVYSEATKFGQDILNAGPDALQDPVNIKEIIYHESRHSEQSYGMLSTSGSLDYGQLVEHIPRFIIDKPEYVSQYASVGGAAESDAETFAHTVDPDIGVANPSDARLFSSEANRKQLTILFELEKDYPGITDYLISHNERLMSAFPS